MPQSKMITLQELANIVRQYTVVTVHSYSKDNSTGVTVRFQASSATLYKAGGSVKALTLKNKDAVLTIEGPTVCIEHDTAPSPAYASIVVTARGFSFRLTMA